MEWAAIISALASMLLEGIQVGNMIGSGYVQDEYNKLSKSIRNALSKNAKLREQVIAAYNDGNNKLTTSLLLSSPVGAAYTHAKSTLTKMSKEYKQEVADLTAKDYDLNAKLNEAAGHVQGGQYFWKAKDSAEKIKELNDNISAAEQSTNGGLTENAKR